MCVWVGAVAFLYIFFIYFIRNQGFSRFTVFPIFTLEFNRWLRSSNFNISPSPAHRGGGEWCNSSRVNKKSRTGRPMVTKILNLAFEHFFIFPENYYTMNNWTLTCDLISKVMLSEICVRQRFDTCHLRTSAFFAKRCEATSIICTAIVTFPRSTGVNDLWWRHICHTFRIVEHMVS